MSEGCPMSRRVSRIDNGAGRSENLIDEGGLRHLSGSLFEEDFGVNLAEECASLSLPKDYAGHGSKTVCFGVVLDPTIGADGGPQ